MHKQLLTTAFAAFLALAIVLGVISSTAQQGEGIIESEPETRFEETSSFPMPETTAEPDQTQEESETTEPETTAESESLTEKVDEAVLLPETPEGAKKLSLYINGRATEEVFCFEKDGIIWLSVEAFGEIFEYGGLSAEAGKCYITSGDRAIPCSKRDVEVTVTDFGVLCAPIEALLSAAGLRSTEIVGDEICIWGVPTFPTADEVYDEEDLYWLSRIISAESRGEPFIGQLAVGTVVINRTGSHYYPDTIYEVIFDRVGGVQFTPASTGSVYRDPTESSILAAKLCLEGFSLDDGILFFFNSSIAAGSWITANRTYTMTVGQHDFYS